MSIKNPNGAKVSSHYSAALEADLMHSWAERSAPKLIELLRRQKTESFPVLVYSGMSGISHAAHLSAELCQYEDFEFGQIYVRKDKEYSHGGPVEGHLPHTELPISLVFVDDFVSTGSTIKRVIKQARAAIIDWRLAHPVNDTVVCCLYSWLYTSRSGVKRKLNVVADPRRYKVLCV